MELAVQNFLRSFATPEEALEAAQKEPYNLKVTQVGSLVCLNYNQIESPKADPITMDCRGLILRYGTWDIVNLSFRRFFNYGEGHAAPIDWSTARVQEKLDGSLLCVWYDDEKREWNISTRGVPGATGPVGFGNGDTFRDRVLPLFKERGGLEGAFKFAPTHWCFSFEYIGPYNRVVTPYEKEELILLAVFDRNTGLEVEIDRDSLWRVPREFGITNLNAVLDSMEALPKLNEGYVIKDAMNRRIKVKNPAYLAVASLVNAGERPTEKNFARIALEAKDASEIKSYFPEFTDMIGRFEELADKLAFSAELLYLKNRFLGDQKSFALAVKDHPISAWFFLRRSGKTLDTARDWMARNYKLDHFLETSRKVEYGGSV